MGELIESEVEAGQAEVLRKWIRQGVDEMLAGIPEAMVERILEIEYRSRGRGQRGRRNRKMGRCR